MKYITVIVFLLISHFLYSQSHNLQQTVRNWPANCDTGGIHWTVYNLEEAANKWLDEASIGSGTNYVPSSNLIVWNTNTGNFPGSPPWLPGDSIIAFGSWDSAYSHDPVFYNFNPNHTGFYWLFSDTLTTQEPQAWQPDDTLRLMPKPQVRLQTTTPGVDSIIIMIPNPQETRRANQSAYDVMGYELCAAEHIGNPGNLVIHVAYLPCQGVYGDTTVYMDIESNYTGSPIFYAYRIIMRPDTATYDSPEPGHAMKYFSMNSDSIFLEWQGIAPGYMNTYLSVNSDSVAISWVTEIKEPEPSFGQFSYPELTASPNPFATSTTIRLAGIGQSAEHIELKIYDMAGREVRHFSLLPFNFSLTTTVVWDGRDNNGKILPSGIYYCRCSTETNMKIEKIVFIE